MCGSTCFGRLPAHHQEHTTALGASGLTVGEQRLIKHFALKITQKITICIRESISISRIKRFGIKSVFLVFIYEC
jgi:hypothetical protein